jgi:hypothetical protein
LLDTVTVPPYILSNSRTAPEAQTRRESRGFSAFWSGVLTTTQTVIPGLVPGTHFPEAVIVLLRLWKMDGRHKGGHDEFYFGER